MTSHQNAIEYATDQMQQGKLTADQANVLIVQMVGMRVARGRLPRDVRNALNAAVKNGELGRVRKEGLKPEIYHHKNARARALDKQDEIARESIRTLSKVYI